MYARASYSADEFPSFMISESDADFASQDFYAGEPVCPQPSRRLEIVPYTYLFLLIAATVGCAFATDAETRQEWTSKFERIASSLATSKQATSAPLPTKEIASADTPGSTPLAPPTPVPPPAAIPPPSQPLPEVTVATAPGDTNDEADAKTPEKPHVSDAYAPPRPSHDPLRKKAEAAGLHPDLSRAVLARLTSTDYRNAAYAIGKAIKTVPNNGEFVWPHKRKAGLAVFTVHFVQGAGRDCRRYVVTVTKDRWTSTALPMEKCGVKVAIRGGKENAIE
ncbi:hypothetical protein [Hyphomicrobium sp. 802]|uniref:hypothetical protein n=1 Tax=Hyphomicrobium sp. 802 TaxID=1112272 RepID=UPI00045E5BB4|nr:hypothetical protein [Hyphomicrobium sp. 802]